MAHLVRPWQVRYIDKHGKRCRSDTPGARRVKERARKWYGAAIPGYPPEKRVPLASDKNVARQMLAELVKKGERGEAGLADKATEAATVPLARHLEDFEAHLMARGTGAKTINLCLTRTRQVFDACGCELPRDIDAEAVMGYLADRRRLPVEQGGIGTQTSNYYLQAVGQFCRWMVRKGKMVRNPMLDTKPQSAKVDRRHDRRNLEPADLERLLDAVRDSLKVYCRLKGRDRHALYLTACGTGFRSQELAALTPESFDLDAEPPTVTLGARDTKNKKPVSQPLPPAVAAVLRGYLRDRPADVPVWPGAWWRKGARMLRKDLKAVGIPYAVKGPDKVTRFADFHALRHTYITLLTRTGVGPKEAQSLARHSDIRLTMGRYTHTDQAALLEALQKLSLPGQENVPVNPLAALVALYGSLLQVLLSGTADGLVARRVAVPPEKTGDISGRIDTSPRRGLRVVG
jgi:integrase